MSLLRNAIRGGEVRKGAGRGCGDINASASFNAHVQYWPGLDPINDVGNEVEGMKRGVFGSTKTNECVFAVIDIYL